MKKPDILNKLSKMEDDKLSKELNPEHKRREEIRNRNISERKFETDADQDGKGRELYHMVIDEEQKYSLHSDIITPIYKALKGKNINDDFISDAIKNFITDSDVRTIFNNNSVKALTDLKFQFEILSNIISEKCNQIIELENKEDDALKDKFIEKSFRPEDNMTQAEFERLTGISKITLAKYRLTGAFISTGKKNTIYNTRSFLSWLKGFKYEAYKKFKEDWLEKNK